MHLRIEPVLGLMLLSHPKHTHALQSSSETLPGALGMPGARGVLPVQCWRQCCSWGST